MLFLTNEELFEFTGYRRPSCMIRQLKEYGVRFFVAADGYPRVPRSTIEDPKEETRALPDFEALRKLSQRNSS